VISVEQVAGLRIAVDLHVLRQQRIQTENFIFAVPDDLRIGVAPEQQMTHQRLPE